MQPDRRAAALEASRRQPAPDEALPRRQDAARFAHADRLAIAVSLDMAQWRQPTAQNYLGRVSKQRIMEAVAQGVSLEAAENLQKLKKDALVSHAEQRLAGTGWLSALLRSPASADEREAPLAAE